MDRLLFVVAVVVGAYALWAGQNPKKAFRPEVPAALFVPSGTPGAVIGTSAVAAARRTGGCARRVTSTIAPARLPC